MRTIELDCPGCQERLELDAGFAGGVCRCSKCGTLMTVPSDPARERAEKLTRPERPDAPGMPEKPAASMPSSLKRPESPGAVAEEEAMVEATLDDDEPAPPAAAAASGGDEIFTTASGKKIRVPRKMIVTAKSKRKVIRGSVIGIFVVFVLAVVVAVFFAVKIMLKQPVAPGMSTTEIISTMGGYDPNTNPFTLKSANFLGIPLSDSAAITVDASSTSSPWLGVVKKSILAGLKNSAPNGKLHILFWIEGGYKSFADDPKHLTESDRGSVQNFFDDVRVRGAAHPGSAVKKAVNSGAKQVILVTGRPLEDTETDDVADALKSKPDVELDAIILSDDDLPKLKKLVHDRKGQYINLPQSQLTNWYRDAEDQGLIKE